MQRVREWGNRTVKVKWVVPAYVILALVILLGGNAIASQNSDDLQQNARGDAITAYTDCARRVETRDDLRGVLFSILALADETDGIRRVTAVINEKYPALSIAECPPLPA